MNNAKTSFEIIFALVFYAIDWTIRVNQYNNIQYFLQLVSSVLLTADEFFVSSSSSLR